MNPQQVDWPPSGDPLVAWATRRTEVLEDGQRGGGENAGEVRMKRQSRDVYPSCTKHGAMNKLSKTGVWRCLVEGCNVGCRYPVPFDNSVLL